MAKSLGPANQAKVHPATEEAEDAGGKLFIASKENKSAPPLERPGSGDGLTKSSSDKNLKGTTVALESFDSEKEVQGDVDVVALKAQQARDKLNDSIFKDISQNERFCNFTLAVIVINALWIGVDTEWNHKNIPTDDGRLPLEPWSTIVENLFCAFFTFEVVMRFGAFKKKKYCLSDAWFVFDSVLVFFMVLETWVFAIIGAFTGGGGSGFLSNFSALRLLRLARLTRMARLMQAVPELMMLCKGMVSATKSVGFIFIFLILVMYVFAIIMTSSMAQVCETDSGELCQWVEEDPEEEDPLVKVDVAKVRFGSIGDAMMTLFTNGVLGDNLNWCVQTILADSVVMMWVFWLFFLISAMTLLNMLIGVLCEVITRRAEEERTIMGETEMRMTLSEAFLRMDTNADGMVTVQEWDQMKSNPSVRRSLMANGIEPNVLDEAIDKMRLAIFKMPATGGDKCNSKRATLGASQHQGLKLEEFTTRLLEIQPSKPASTLELQLLRTKVEQKFEARAQELDALEGELATLMASRGIAINPDEIRYEKSMEKNLMKLPTQTLLAMLRARTANDVKVQGAQGGAASEQAFPAPEAAGVSGSDPSAGKAAGMSKEEHISRCALVRQHPLFEKLVGRQLVNVPGFPGGWAAARFVAEQLENTRMTLPTLSQQCGSALSIDELQTLLGAVPEFFVMDHFNGTACVRQFEVDHVHGCPRHKLSTTPIRDSTCHCVWKLCDSLGLFTEDKQKRGDKDW